MNYPTIHIRRQQLPLPMRRDPHFLFIITNDPDFLAPTRHSHQPSNQYWQQQQNRFRYRYSSAQGGMLTPGVRVHLGDIYTDQHEQLLYNTLRFQLEYILRNYLTQTHRMEPIHFLFDMSNLPHSHI